MGFLKIYLIIVLCLVSILAGVMIYKNNFFPEIPCLEEIAEDYCEEQGLYFDEISLDFGWGFWCIENLRQTGFTRYKFLEDEIEGCKND